MMQENSGKMTNGQRIKALLNYEKPDRVPLWPFFDMTGFAAIYHNRPIKDAYSDARLSLEMQRKVCQDFGWICSPFFPVFGVIDFGGERKLPTSEFSQAPSTVRYPIEKEEDIDKLKIPDLNNANGIIRENEFHKLCGQNRPDNQPFRAVLFISPNPYEWAGRLCRPDMLNRWIIKRPDLIKRILLITGELITELIDYWYEAIGTEDVLVMSGGVICSNQIISPRQFEKYVLPYQIELHEKLLKRGISSILCHICGEQNANLSYWSQVPMGDFEIISVGKEIDISTAIEYFGNKCVIAGNIEPALIQTGTPQEIYECCRQAIEKGKRAQRGYALMHGCEVPVDTPPYNFYTMKKAINDFGWY